jgi:hypothetical protein
VTDTAYGQIATIEDTTEVAEATGTVAIVDTESAVRSYFSDIPVLIEVARCESTFRHTLADGTVLKGRVDSRDIGVMQIISYYHGTEAAALGLDLYNLQDNMKYARILYEKQGTLPWKSSSACWSRTLASA